MELDFNFLKKRNLGELIQDYFTLVRKVFKHFTITILTLSSIFIAIFLVLFFYISGNFVAMITDPVNFAANPLLIILSLLPIFILFPILFIVVYGISVEYSILLKERGSTDFSYKDVFNNFKQNIGVYLKAVLASIVISFIIVIPLFLISVVLALIPIIGSFIIQIIMSIVGIYFYCSILLYREKRYGLTDAFTKGFSFVKDKIFEQGLASFIIQLIISIVLGIITLILIVIIGLIFYNTIGLNLGSFFLSFIGKMIIAVISSIFLVIFVLSSTFPLLFMTLVYYTNVEYNFNESSLSDIDEIGETKDEF